MPHTGAGANRDAARAPVILDKGGVKIGFLQRTSVYWPTNHEATKGSAGVAVIKGHTAYQLPLHKTRVDIPPCNRPGLPPVILTWADVESLKAFTDDVAALKAKTNFVVASCHWGLHKDVLNYMPQIAHAAIDAGADVVIGHGPHYSLPVEVYKGRPIYYGLGSFSFHTGHFGGVAVGDWVGMIARITLDAGKVTGAWLAAPLLDVRASDLASFLMPPGVLAVAFALNFSQVLPPASGQMLLSTVAVGTAAFELFALAVVPRWGPGRRG